MYAIIAPCDMIVDRVLQYCHLLSSVASLPIIIIVMIVSNKHMKQRVFTLLAMMLQYKMYSPRYTGASCLHHSPSCPHRPHLDQVVLLYPPWVPPCSHSGRHLLSYLAALKYEYHWKANKTNIYIVVQYIRTCIMIFPLRNLSELQQHCVTCRHTIIMRTDTRTTHAGQADIDHGRCLLDG